MSADSKIEWCEHTFNPWWGCIEVSPACDNCYARTFAKRTGHQVWGPAKETPRRFFADKHWNEPRKWNAAAEAAGKPARVFCASMADVFEENADLNSERARLWALIEDTPWLTWLLLTKRPHLITGMVPADWLASPRPNVWYGTTVENQHYADQRIPTLLKVPTAKRFLSMEPLLGPVTLQVSAPCRRCQGTGIECSTGPRIDWVITGGESGHGARPAHPDWYRSLMDQCVAAGVAFHFKQWGEHAVVYERDRDDPDWQRCTVVAEETPKGQWLNLAGGQGFHGERLVRVDKIGKKAAGRLLDGRTWDESPAPAAPDPSPAGAAEREGASS